MTRIKNTVKSDDYAVVHADGVITQLGSEVTRLVFYQEVFLPAEDDSIDQNERTKVLQFEVRVPRSVISSVIDYLYNAEKSIESTDKVREQTDDEKIHNLSNQLDSKLEELLIDSNTDYSEDKEVTTLTEQYHELKHRCEREFGVQSSQENEDEVS